MVKKQGLEESLDVIVDEQKMRQHTTKILIQLIVPRRQVFFKFNVTPNCNFEKAGGGGVIDE